MNTTELFIKMGLHSWHTQIDRMSQFLNGLTEEQLLQEIAPGKNRGIYIMGHLLVIHDAMNTILGVGERSYSHLDAAFLHNPDKSGIEMPSVQELRTYWDEVHAKLAESLRVMPAEDWFKKHTNISDEDFAKEPARNKLSVLINRANHAAYHFGQLRLIR